MKLSIRLLLSLVLVFAVVCSTFAQEAGAPHEIALPTKVELDQAHKQAQDNAELIPEVKKNITAVYEQCLAALMRLDEMKAQDEGYQKRLDEAPKKIADLTARLAKPFVPFEGTTETKKGAAAPTLEKMEDLLKESTDEFDRAKRALAQNETALNDRYAQVVQITQRLSAIPLEQDALKDESSRLLNQDLLTLFMKRLCALKLAGLDAEESSLKNNQKYLTLLGDWLPQQQTDLRRQLEFATQKKKFYEAQVAALTVDKREEDLQREQSREQAMLKKCPELEPLIQTNKNYLAELKGEGSPASLVKIYNAESKRLTEVLRGVLQNQYYMNQRVKISGMDRESGMRMFEQYRSLPELLQSKVSWEDIRAGLNRAQSQLLQFTEDRQKFTDMTAMVNTQYREMKTTVPKELVASDIEELLTARWHTLVALQNDYAMLIQSIVGLNDSYRALTGEMTRMRKNLLEELLWTQSTEAISFTSLKLSLLGVVGLLSIPRWSSFVWHIYMYFVAYPQNFILLLALCVGLFYWCPVVKRRIPALVPEDCPTVDIPFVQMFKVLLVTLLIPTLLTLLLYCVYYGLHQIAVKNPTDVLAAHFFWGFNNILTFSWIVLFIIYVCLPGGFATRHLGWNAAKVDRVHVITRRLAGVIFLSVPMFGGYLTAITFIVPVDEGAWIAHPGLIELSRMNYLLISLLLSWYFWRLFDPFRGIFSRELLVAGEVENAESLVFVPRMPQVFITGVCLFTAALFGFGFELAGVVVLRFMLQGLAILTLAALLNGLVIKYLHKYQTNMMGMLKKRLAALSRLSAHDVKDTVTGPAETELSSSVVGMDGVVLMSQEDKDTQYAHMQQLFTRTISLTSFIIWGAAVVLLLTRFVLCAPALDKVGRIELWTIPVEASATQTQATAAPAVGKSASAFSSASSTTATLTLAGTMESLYDLGKPAASPQTKGQPITVYHLLGAIFLLMCSFLGGKYLKDSLDLLLRQFPISASSRYGIRTIAGYVVSIIGIALALGLLGITWSSVQWILAAASVGLGFGLQEVFANLVCGLIILVERPIRVGDTVTIGGVTGRVMSISMRATIIRDFDLKELIVPNKQIITGQVINASLSSSIVRCRVTFVCRATHTDPQVVFDVILKAARQDPNILQDPEPIVFLDSVENNSSFVLLYYINPMKSLEVKVRSRLNETIREQIKRYIY